MIFTVYFLMILATNNSNIKKKYILELFSPELHPFCLQLLQHLLLIYYHYKNALHHIVVTLNEININFRHE